MRYVAILTAVVAAVVVATSASAAPKFSQATGGLKLIVPSQQVSFEVFDYGTTGDRGTFKYENFEYPGGLSYSADILCANVNSATGEAWFTFQIPDGWPGLSGLYVGVYVKDGGSPGVGNDIYGHTVVGGPSWCDAPGGVGTYEITNGNISVH
jgi:hypothetical protein